MRGVKMSDHKQSDSFTPFPEGYRASGLLLHITSLPSAYGIGDMGPSAFEWVDLLCQAGQGWWQALPVGPTGSYNSPYQSLSSFAGNGLLISPEYLIEDGLLSPEDREGWSFSAEAVEYDKVISFKHGLMAKIWRKFNSGRPDLRPDFDQFCSEQAAWLDDYALFRALKIRYGGRSYLEWPADLVRREPAALSKARDDMAEFTEMVRLAQFLLYRQGRRLKEYANEKGLRLIGDLPFFVSPDSSDVWVNPELFLLDDKMRPRFVGGVPPDYFSECGQLWGNPVYDWEAHRLAGYRWWIERIRAQLVYVDVLRLDHFRGFEAAWHVPAGASTAKYGEWVPGPGAGFFEAAGREFNALPFIAEDLGLITPGVGALRDQFHLPGTRVLQFAFDGHPDNPHLPENYVPNTVVYTGTHDNDTTRGWFERLSEEQKRGVWRHLKRSGWESEEVAGELIRLAWSSAAALAIVPLQDLLNLGTEARMNVPGCAEGNWRWRFTKGMLSDGAFSWLKDLTEASKRTIIPDPRKP